MEKIIIEEIKKKEKKDLYSHLWGNEELLFEVVKTGKNDTSYEFDFGGDDLITMAGKKIARNFSIEDQIFLEKFKTACSGTGDELRKITTLHSSSLCSLLFFYNVSESTPVDIDRYKFTESYFEFKNKVIGYPSNIDVVLLGVNTENKKKVILFLESKFSEFITGVNSKLKVGKSYFSDKDGCFSKAIYENLEKNNIINLIEDENYISSKEKKYLEGIKQMISHYYGIRNFINEKFYDEENENQKKVKNFYKENKQNCEILLAGILFDNLSDNQKEKYLAPYEADYIKLAEIINEQICKNNIKNFKMLEKTLKYSSLKNRLNPKIKKFYFGKLHDK